MFDVAWRYIDICRYREVVELGTFIGGEFMRQERKRRWTTWLQRVEFCDACGQVCTPGCRAAAARAAAVDGRLAAGLLR